MRKWIDDALCAGMDPAVFFPLGRRDSEKAKAICHRCPVEWECLQSALRAEVALPCADRHSVAGVRGGVDGTTRLRTVLRLRRAAGIANVYENDETESDDAA